MEIEATRINVKPYGATLKDKLYYTTECLTNLNDYLASALLAAPIMLTGFLALLPIELINNKAMDYRLKRLEKNGVVNPSVGNLHLEDILDFWSK